MIPLAAPLLLACTPLGPWSAADAGNEAGDVHRLVVSPGTIDFGTVSVNAQGSAVGQFTVYNLGNMTETIAGQDAPEGSAAFAVAADPLLDLDPGASLTFDVTFEPTTDEEDIAELVVRSATERATIRLSGIGTAPVLDLGDPRIGDTIVGCASEGEIPVRNDGSEPLQVTSATAGTSDFEITTLPDTIDPGATASIGVRFSPGGGGPRGGTVLVRTNDPAHPERSVVVSAAGLEGDRRTEHFRYTPSNATDILFVVETDDAMEPHLAKVSPAIRAYADTLRSANVDFHVAAVSSGDACPASSPSFVGTSDTSLALTNLLNRGFTGEDGAWDTDLWGLALAALDQSLPSGCLDGFQRSDADLHVILVAARGPDATVADEIEALAGWVADDHRLRLDALLPAANGCGSDASDYAEAIATWGGSVEDLCSDDWTAAFSRLATYPEATEPVRFAPSRRPIPSTLAVTVEGVAFTSWSWDASSDTVVFDGTHVPALGAEVVVSYVPMESCG